MVRIGPNFRLEPNEQRAVVRSFDGETPAGPRSFDQFTTAISNDLKNLTTTDGFLSVTKNTLFFLAPVIACGAAGSFAAARLFAKSFSHPLLLNGVRALGDETLSDLFTASHRKDKTPASWWEAYQQDWKTGMSTRLGIGLTFGALSMVLPQVRIATTLLLPFVMAGANWLSEAVFGKNSSLKGEGLGWEFLYRTVMTATMIHGQARLLQGLRLHADDWRVFKNSTAQTSNPLIVTDANGNRWKYDRHIADPVPVTLSIVHQAGEIEIYQPHGAAASISPIRTRKNFIPKSKMRLSDAEVLELFRQIWQEGSKKAKEKLAHSALDDLDQLARRYNGRSSAEYPELYSAGAEGLARAIRDYNPNREVPFYAYVRIRIRFSIIDRLRQSKRKLITIDLESPFADPRTQSPLEIVLDEKRSKQLNDEIQRLPERLRIAVELYYGPEQLKLKEIGDRIGITEAGVSYRLQRAYEMLRGRLTGSSRLDPAPSPEPARNHKPHVRFNAVHPRINLWHTPDPKEQPIPAKPEEVQSFDSIAELCLPAPFYHAFVRYGITTADRVRELAANPRQLWTLLGRQLAAEFLAYWRSRP